jgi:hypothetical protein
LLTRPFSTSPQGTALTLSVTLRPKLTPPTGRGQTIRTPAMSPLTKVSPWIRRTQVALFATRPQVAVQGRWLALRVATLSLLPMPTVVKPHVTPAAQVRFTNPIMLKTVCTVRMQETTWPSAKSATDSRALLILMGVSLPPVAPTLPATPLPGPIQPIGRGKMTQRRIIDQATATQGTRSMPAPSVTITLEADPRLIQTQSMPVATLQDLPMQTGPTMNVTLTARVTETMTDLRIGIYQYLRAGG